MLRNANGKATYLDPSAAHVYHQHNGLQYTQACRFMDEVAAYLVSPVLDIGSGDGKVSAFLANQYNVKVTGLDISSERVALAKQQYATTSADFVVGNALALDETPAIAHQQYQTIVSFNTIHHLPGTEQLAFFKQARAKLTDNGRAIFLIPGLSEYHEAIKQAANARRWKAYFADFDLRAVRTYENAEYYCHLAYQAGFNLPCQVTEADEPGIEMDFDGLKNYFAGWLPHLAHLKAKNVNTALQDEFLQDIVSLYFAKHQIDKAGKVNPTLRQNKMVFFKTPSARLEGSSSSQNELKGSVEYIMI